MMLKNIKHLEPRFGMKKDSFTIDSVNFSALRLSSQTWKRRRVLCFAFICSTFGVNTPIPFSKELKRRLHARRA